MFFRFRSGVDMWMGVRESMQYIQKEEQDEEKEHTWPYARMVPAAAQGEQSCVPWGTR